MDMRKLVAIALALAALALAPACAEAGAETFTLMVYMCGTDLESDGGAATADLAEMVRGGVTDGCGVTVLVQTGGTKRWQADGITDREAQRWRLTTDGLTPLSDLGRANMGDQQTLRDFLAFGYGNYPADRYALILWDHGGGAAGGVCYDELTGDMLQNPELYGALDGARVSGERLAFVGFDACLMASYETALHIAPFADYMVASEELEPGTGWDYAAWLSALARDPGADIGELGKAIADSFVASSTSYYRGDYATLSVCDLGKLPALRAAVERMGDALADEIAQGGFARISKLRQNMRSFGEIDDGEASDMVDMGVFAEAYARYDEDGASALRAALEDVVVYERHTSNLSNLSGLSILLPYATRASASTYLPAYDRLGLSPDYSDFVEGMVGGLSGAGGYTLGSASVQQQSIQAAQVDWFSQYAEDQSGYYDGADSLWGDWYGGSYGEQNADDFSLDSFLSELFSSGDAGFDADYDASAASLWGDVGDDADYSFATNTGYGSGFWAGLTGGAPVEAVAEVNVQTDAGDVALPNPFAGVESDYAYTVQLTDDQLEHLGKVEAYLMMDVSDPDFECYVDLGYVEDVVVDWNRGKIYGLFDGTWATLDGQMVCLYDQIANDRYIRSLIPVTLNGEPCYLLVIFDDDAPGGEVVGYTEGYTEAGAPVRGYSALAEGDVVVPQYELIYWDEDGEQQFEPFEGAPITVGAGGAIPFGYEPVEEDADYAYGFCLNDVFGGYTYTDVISLSF